MEFSALGYIASTAMVEWEGNVFPMPFLPFPSFGKGEIFYSGQRKSSVSTRMIRKEPHDLQI